ncbi:transposase [Massilia glaciei]|uniref:Transposase n=1 Tax=Massilia glaciei TaxID=1524097 RepID=A0A2U2HHH6_9BURK|nr:transposase [Massilia glaciei]PWF45112.1 transposase [Massilia glaciei]
MARRARLVLADVPLHIIQRGNNRHRCFAVDSDYLVYLDLLATCASESGCAIHAYVLMTNHVHLLASPSDKTSPARMMKAVGERYVQYFNRRHTRTGTLWDGRFRSGLVDEERYFLICQRYIELNPVRAGLVNHPAEYRWSSFKNNSSGGNDSFLTAHPITRQMGIDRQSRTDAYLALFKESVLEDDLCKIRYATNGNYAVGTEQFFEKAAGALGQRVCRQSPGRRPGA